MKQKQKVKVIAKKETHYPAYYLGLVLAGVLLLEGLMLGATSPEAWQQGLQVLDMSDAVSIVVVDIGLMVSPMMEQVSYVNDFYQAAATEMILLIDFSDHDFMAGPRLVMDAYDMASVEVANMIDFTAQAEYWPQVAGASLQR